MINIPLGDNKRITSDPWNYILQKEAGFEKDGRIKWKSLGFWTTLPAMLTALMETRIKGCDATTLSELREAITEAQGHISSLQEHLSLPHSPPASTEAPDGEGGGL